MKIFVFAIVYLGLLTASLVGLACMRLGGWMPHTDDAAAIALLALYFGALANLKMLFFD